MIDWTHIAVAFIVTLPATITALAGAVISLVGYIRNRNAIAQVQHTVNHERDEMKFALNAVTSEFAAFRQAVAVKDAREGKP